MPVCLPGRWSTEQKLPTSFPHSSTEPSAKVLSPTFAKKALFCSIQHTVQVVPAKTQLCVRTCEAG